LPELGEHTENVAWWVAQDDLSLVFFDETERQFFWVGSVIDPEHGVQLLVFEEQCWAGPTRLPAPDSLPAGMPARHCPELAATFAAKVRAQSQLAP